MFMRLQIFGVFVALVLVSQCGYGSSGGNFRSGYQLDYREIARQNRITEQILQNYLEKRLFPNNNRPSKAPTVWDILPSARKKSANKNNIQEVLNGTTQQETLESGESEQVPFYDDDKEDKIGQYDEDSPRTPVRVFSASLKRLQIFPDSQKGLTTSNTQKVYRSRFGPHNFVRRQRLSLYGRRCKESLPTGADTRRKAKLLRYADYFLDD